MISARLRYIALALAAVSLLTLACAYMARGLIWPHGVGSLLLSGFCFEGAACVRRAADRLQDIHHQARGRAQANSHADVLAAHREARPVNATSPFPYLAPRHRTGLLTCDARPTEADPVCRAPATWHIAWTLAQPAQFSLVCDRHLAWVQQQFVYADRHPAVLDCDMPGTGWLTVAPSRCVMAPTTTT
ncbi:hypothetical protein [Streptomyces sp. NPDC001876]|uniref:hypothetical protein n=1 Tax=Streptomyces sp. NPDC001876 TaxID=3154402 RepID=UPI00332F200C